MAGKLGRPRRKPVQDNTLRCSKCADTKHTSEFGPDKRATSGKQSYCLECQRLLSAAWRYGSDYTTVKDLYSRPTCDCCGAHFAGPNDQHLHHLGLVGKQAHLRGVLCRACNLVLRDESNDVIHRLRCCLEYMGVTELTY